MQEGQERVAEVAGLGSEVSPFLSDPAVRKCKCWAFNLFYFQENKTYFYDDIAKKNKFLI